MFKDFSKVKLIIEHPENNSDHFIGINNCIELYYDKWGDRKTYKELKALFDDRFLSKGSEIILNG